ncbi:hypothetical protein C7H79_10225 [Nitrosomonas supralitoralis]|uniref:Uncharacterized protein n=2 Tax=Nitrosomonas supralitoralis TaxID=2116706 RepID=A0A2P7NUD7_9PROT|nr:hypothetical protein C7H79_10225 [Nitrosomonas supralitoralis]
MLPSRVWDELPFALGNIHDFWLVGYSVVILRGKRMTGRTGGISPMFSPGGVSVICQIQLFHHSDALQILNVKVSSLRLAV